MVLLNENDRVEDLNKILDEFCLASSTRFNEKKMDFLPFGPKEYRAQVLEQRKLNSPYIKKKTQIHLASTMTSTCNENTISTTNQRGRDSK